MTTNQVKKIAELEIEAKKYKKISKKIKIVNLCTQCFTVKGYTIDIESDKSIIDWAKFCKKCSEFLEGEDLYEEQLNKED